MKARNAICTFLFLVTAFATVACSPKDASNDSTSKINENYQYVMMLTPVTNASTLSATGRDHLIQISNSKETIYLLYGYNQIDGVPASYGIELFDRELNPERKIDFIPQIENSYIVSFCVASDGSYWIHEAARELAPDASVYDGRNSLLRNFDADGLERSSTDLSDKFGIRFFELSAADKHGNIYICYGDNLLGPNRNIALIDANGDMVVKWEDDLTDNVRIAVLHDGKTIAMQWGGLNPNRFFELMDNGDLEFVGEIDIRSDILSAGIGNYVYIVEDKDLYRLHIDTFETDLLASVTYLTDIVRETIHDLVELSDDNIYARISGRIYTFVESSEIHMRDFHTDGDDARSVINVAMYYDTETAFVRAISEFNATNAEYRMVATDYSIYDTEPDGGIKQLNLEIITGKVPDIFLWGIMANYIGFDSAMYAQYGIFADVYEFLDNDPEYSKDSFIPNISYALESSDAKLYELPLNFHATVVACSSSDIELEKWNFDEFYAELEKHPDAEFIYGAATKETILYLTLINNWDVFIDWNTRECNFEQESFIRLLSFCNTYVGDVDDLESYTLANEAIADGLQYLVYNSISTIGSIQKFKALFNGDITFIGFPTENGRGNSIQMTGSASIYSGSPYKDVCWEFIRQFCDKDYQLANFRLFPTNIGAIEELFAHPEKYEEAGAGVAYVGQNGEEFAVTFSDPTDEEIAQMKELIFSLDRVRRQNSALIAIIFEDAYPFFDGYRTAEEAARIIQSRVSVYLSETA